MNNYLLQKENRSGNESYNLLGAQHFNQTKVFIFIYFSCVCVLFLYGNTSQPHLSIWSFIT